LPAGLSTLIAPPRVVIAGRSPVVTLLPASSLRLAGG